MSILGVGVDHLIVFLGPNKGSNRRTEKLIEPKNYANRQQKSKTISQLLLVSKCSKRFAKNKNSKISNLKNLKSKAIIVW